jgi:hypothetical protein
MITTSFYIPTVVNQVSIPNPITGIPSIDWNYEAPITPNNPANSKQALYTISGMWMEKFLSNTSQLWCTNLSIPNNNQTVTGIEVELNVFRQARIEDLIIQLTKDGETLAGDNRASTVNPVQSDVFTGELTTPLNPVGDYNIYGNPTDLWGTTWTSEEISNSTFGIVISFRSNIIYPHRDLASINQVGIRVTYA